MLSRPLAIAAIVVAAILWSIDPLIRFPSVETVDPVLIGFFEHFFGLLVCAPFFLFFGRKEWKRLGWSHMPAVAATGLGGSALGAIFYTESLKYTGPSSVNIFQFVQPFVVLFFAYLFLGERRSGNFVQLAVWVFLGSAVLCLPDITFGFTNPQNDNFGKGIGWGMLTALLWGGSTVAGKWLLRYFSPITVLFLRWSLATICLAALVLLRGKSIDFSALTAKDIGGFLLLGTLAGVIPMWIYYQGLRVLPASAATLIELLYPLFGIFIPVFLRSNASASGSQLSELQWAGGIAVFLGVAFLIALELGFGTAPEPTPKKRRR